VTGETQSTNFPATPGTLDPIFNGLVDAFVTKLNPAGSAPLYSTYLGGTGDDRGLGIAVDSVGNAYVTGRTSSVNFPTTAGAFDTTYNGGSCDAFVVKISDIGPPATLTLDPAADTNPVGTSHCVTATVHDAFANPTPGVVVRFTVTGAINTTGSATTDANGEADFCYVGPSSPGLDAITAFADTDNDGMSDVGEPNGAAGKTWTPGAPATLLLTPPADTNPVATVHCVTAIVQDAFGNPTPGVIVRFTVTGAVVTSGSATTGASGQATFCYGGPATPGVDAITAFADSNGNSAQDLGEPAGGAMKTWVPGPPATLTLTPLTASNTVDSQHCVTATVRDAVGNPTPGVVVRFTVAGSVNTGGSAPTDASGQATFCYQGPPLPGADAIGAYADTDNDATQDPGEPTGAATKAWVLPATTPLCEILVLEGGQITAANGDRATFNGHARSSGSGDAEGTERYRDHGPAQPLDMRSINVQAIVCDGPGQEASIYGEATINGTGSFFYRIKVRDLGEPGAGQDTYWILLENGYTSGDQTLEGGNIQIRRPMSPE
jgi:hypothetical protein